ncbi:splicing factor 3a protein, putative [Eimeria maxima]|uniref:Splicing factor 3a protein, putative n=1 Tax=Eimeria maxima TaxID=5804 RepID=U6M4E4_EIMMA|nr:splicing factor 3a protein, putative [Eimeria maxima]CDJ58906.1 splicing factor 3a protein, putative [Eimeria maxima]
MTKKIKSSEETDKQIALLEFTIKYFVDLLQPQINQTIAHYQKKQSTNAEEALEEENDEDSNEEDAAAEEDSEAEEEEGPIYNPLNLPLGTPF